MTTFYNAGAGSGKTHTLASDLAKFLLNENGHPSQVILTTFSKKSAEELKERVRKTLIEKGFPAKAAEMSNAMIGTVNAVCSQLVEKYAFEMGLSPVLRVMDDVSTDIFFNEFISNSIEPGIFEELGRTCRKFGAFEGKSGSYGQKDSSKPVWPAVVKKLASRFRSYDFKEADAKRSKAEAMRLAGSFLLTRKKFSVNDIWKLIVQTASQQFPEDLAIKDKTAIEGIGALRRYSNNKDQVVWSDFETAGAELAIKTTKKYPWLTDLVAACDQYHCTVEFAQEYLRFIELLYDTAFSLIRNYQEFKQERGLIDFADQELLLLQMLQENEIVQQEIKTMFKLVMVDEFQDSSPVQLAIFLKLRTLVTNSVWVGDPKQAIYAFRDSDPALFNIALDTIAKEKSDNIQKLENSYRSRPGLVNAVNAAFSGVFKGLLKKEHIILEASDKLKNNEKKAGGFTHPALQVQFYNDPRIDDYFKSLAVSVKKTLNSGMRVYDKKEDHFRSIRPGDIALLFRSNADVASAAGFFKDMGIAVSSESEGLQDYAEIYWMRCLLRLLINDGDPLAIAQLAVLEKSFDNVEAMLEERLKFMNTSSPEKPWSACSITAEIISTQRNFLALMPLVQAVRHLITVSGLSLYCRRWGNAVQRTANIHRVIELSSAYQEQCNLMGLSASFPGFLEHLCNCFDLPATVTDDAVTLMTAHKAKGLEWPMVYLVKLDVSGDDCRTLFNDIHVLQPPAGKKTTLLGGQTIIYLPWPFGSKQKLERVSGDLLDKRIELDNDVNAFAKFRQEEDRLLYVAFTRARDYLVLPYYKKSSGCGIESEVRYQPSGLFTADHWELLKNAATTEPSLKKIEKHTIQIQSFPAFVAETVAVVTPRAATTFYNFGERSTTAKYERRYRVPSLLEASGNGATIRRLSFDEPMLALKNLSPELYAPIGTAIHLAYASWNPQNTGNRRIEIMNGIVNKMSLGGHIPVAELDNCFVRFTEFMNTGYAPVSWKKEVPLHDIGDGNGRITSGIADLVLETEKGLVLVDHKTFPGHFDTMALDPAHEHYAGRYAGQLKEYKVILEKATGKNVVAVLLHYVVQGKLVEVCI